MSLRLDLDEAERLLAGHLGSSPRAAHSRLVAQIMAELARCLQQDAGLWRVVGLLHDLDYFDVAADWTRHGVLTAERLAGRLSQEALMAIAAHDHRTGVLAKGALADALRLADALAILGWQSGRDAILTSSRIEDWRRLAGERTFLFEMISELSSRLGLDFGVLLGVLGAVCEQDWS